MENPSVIVENVLLLPEQFYFMSSQLNDAQKRFFSFIITYIVKRKTTFKNNEKEPEPFCLHLNGGAGVREGFCYKCHN